VLHPLRPGAGRDVGFVDPDDPDSDSLILVDDGPFAEAAEPRPIRIDRRHLRHLFALGVTDLAQAVAILLAARRRVAAEANRGARPHA
jgi:hypothetical protein